MIYMPSNNLFDYASYVPFLKNYWINVLVYRTKRNIFHSSFFALLQFGTMLCGLFINTVICIIRAWCKDQADNLLQVFNIVRLSVAQKLRLQKWFKFGVFLCQGLGDSAVCMSPDSASLLWEHLCLGTEGAGCSVLGCGGRYECEGWATLCKRSSWQNMFIPPFIFLVAQLSVQAVKNPHSTHRRRADFREVVNTRV